jgi:hypothetical protein
MYNISAGISKLSQTSFADELEAAKTLGINNIEIDDKFDGTPIWELDGNKTEDVRNLLIDSNKKIVLLRTELPVNRLEDYRKLFRTAHLMLIENVKVPLPESEAEIDLLYEIAKIAMSYGIRMLFENKAHSLAEDDASMTALYKKFKGLHIGFVYNPLEFVAMQRHPFFHMFYTSKLKNHIVFMRLNDGLYSTLEPKPLCEGNAEVKELVSILLARSFEGYFSLTPYMGNGLEDLKKSHEELKTILKSI